MAIVLRNVTAEVIDLEYEMIPSENPHRLMVRGQLSKQIIFGADKGIVNYQDALAPFEVMIELDDPTPTSDIQVKAEIEHISSRLLDDGVQVDQQIILKVYIEPDELRRSQVQNFLIRSVDYLKDPQVIELKEDIEPESDVGSSEIKRAFQKVKVKARHPQPEPKIIPIPDVTLIINEKLEELEELLHDELEESLRLKLHQEVEDSLRHKIEQEVIDSVHHQLRHDLEESIYYRLRNEFETRLQEQLVIEREQMKKELQQEEQLKRARYYDEIRKKSLHQQRNGYRTKG